MGYIYLRKNLSNGKCYVGQAKDIKDRNRKWNSLKVRYGGYAINNARKKYGADGFSFELLKECPNEDMNYWEMYYVKMYNSKKPYGYNSTDGGDSTCEMTEETKAKIAAAHRGKKLSEDTRKKMGEAHRGKKLSEEHKAKLSAAKRGKSNPKLSAAMRGKKRPDISALQSKPIQALDPKTLEVVMEFPSTAEAQRQGFSAGNISQCCLGKRKTAYGFIWRFAS